MKNLMILLILIWFSSCSKKDNINHYLNKKVTEQELIDNGLYKYSFTDTIFENPEDKEGFNYVDKIIDLQKNKNSDDENYGEEEEQNKDSIENNYIENIVIKKKILFIDKHILYSNVKPQKQLDGKLYPVAFFGGSNTKENVEYLEEQLDNRIITYEFINNTLKYKSVFVYDVKKNKTEIADFRTKENIIKYYDSLKIPIKTIINGKTSTVKRTTLFLINNYKTQIYYSATDNFFAYDILTNYVDGEMPYRDIKNGWYSGDTYELSK